MEARTIRGLLRAAALLASPLLAGPVTTAPWNGHAGAASFTFDDDCPSQLANVVPALKARGIHATFYLYDVGNAFSNNKAAWVAASRDGNELGNHSINHADFSKSIDATREVSGMASRLRAADPSVEAVTFAYPYCAVGYKSAVGAENIIGRGCMFGASFRPLQWKSPPSDWNDVGAIYVGDDATASGPTLAALDAAKAGGWISTLNHGVGGDWASVSTAKVLALFDRAIRNGLWIGTYQEVAAYWRAGLTMDTSRAIATDSGWILRWNSPHPRMPRKVALRVRLDSAVFGRQFSVHQSGSRLAPQSDGTFVIEFMAGALQVRRGGTTRAGRPEGRQIARSAARWENGVLHAPGWGTGRVAIQDALGHERILEIHDGRAHTGLLPAGVYWLHRVDSPGGDVRALLVTP